ncbi:ADP-ribosyl cyclase/cyclic ADP-ribose hydrolase 1-like [Epinephelus lanceolatus]
MKRVVAVGVGVLGVGVVVSLLVLFIPQTVQFRKTFMRRCEEFPQHNHSCKDTLDTFEGAYVDKEPFSFSEQNYDPLFEKISFTHASNKTMLWSDTKALVHDFTKKRDCFITLEDTLLGFVMDGQKWCGLKGNKETFSVFCELVKNNNPVISFWKNASARFAAYASGEVTAMLNGGLKTPYNPNSIFASIEVKRLFYPKVTRLTIVLLTDKENVKKCNENESLQNLKNELDQKGILYSCKEVTRSHIRKCIKENNACGACW